MLFNVDNTICFCALQVVQREHRQILICVAFDLFIVFHIYLICWLFRFRPRQYNLSTYFSFDRQKILESCMQSLFYSPVTLVWSLFDKVIMYTYSIIIIVSSVSKQKSNHRISSHKLRSTHQADHTGRHVNNNLCFMVYHVAIKPNRTGISHNEKSVETSCTRLSFFRYLSGQRYNLMKFLHR